MQVVRDSVGLYDYEESEPIARCNLANKEKLSCQRAERHRLLRDQARMDVSAALSMAEDNDHHSLGQSHIFESVAHVFKEEIAKMDCHSLPINLPDHAPVVLNMADMRCATSPKTVSHMVTVYDVIRRRYATDYSVKIVEEPAPAPQLQQQGSQQQPRNMPEVMAFFQGLPNSDFNRLFQSLRPPQPGSSVYDAHEQGVVKEQGFYVCGVPGSFFGRLFPSKSLHVVMSILCLQWLSQPPPGVSDKNSPAFNRERIWLQGAQPEVHKAYWLQFKRDLTKFLMCRAQEIASGGLLLLLLPGTATDFRQPGSEYVAFGLFEKAWNQLVSEGYIDPKEQESFNLPVYLPTLDEVQQIIEEFNSGSSDTTSSPDRLEVRRLEFFENQHIFPDDVRQALQGDANTFGRIWTRAVKSQLNSLVEQHLGSSLTNTLFCKMSRLATENADEVMGKLSMGVIVAVLSSK